MFITSCGGGGGSSALPNHPATAAATLRDPSSSSASASGYGSTVLSDLPTAYFHLNDTGSASVASDASNHGNSATYGSWLNRAASGLIAGDYTAPYYDGLHGSSGVFATAPSALSLEATSTLSVEAWVMPGKSPANYMPIVAYGSNASAPYEPYILEEVAGNRFAFQVALRGRYVQAVSDVNFTVGTSYHVVGTYDGSTVKIYVNGRLAGTSNGGGPIADYSSTGLAIGNNGDRQHEFQGSIEEVAVYTHSLSETSIASHYSVGATGSVSQSTAVTDNAAVVQNSSVPTHILTYQAHLKSTDRTSFGSNYSVAGHYLNYALTDQLANDGLRAAGIKTGFYTDMHMVCTSRSYGACTPDASTVAENAFAHSCNGKSRITVNPPWQSPRYVTDASSSNLLDQFNSIIDNEGYSYGRSIHFDFVFDDDAGDLNETLNWLTYYDYTGGAVQRPAPFCGYTEAKWIAGVKKLDNGAHLPVIANALGTPDDGTNGPSLGTQYYSGNSNLIGAMLESVYGSVWGDVSRFKETGAVWQSEENTELTNAHANKLFVGYEHIGGTDPIGLDRRLYVYASLMLSYDMGTTAMAEDGTPTNSNLMVLPEALLVPTLPLVSEPYSIEALQTATGVYAREYQACYYAGKLIGPCAAVVNSSATNVLAFPSLSRSYWHTLGISGAGVVPGTDNGSLNFNGPNPPRNLAPQEAVIVF